MKNSMILFMMLFFFSCKESKPEFIESKTMSLFLLKNPPKEDSLVKKEIKLFLLKNPPKYTVRFYKYTYDTSYFIENDEDDGFGAKTIDMYQDEDGIAVFGFIKCQNEVTKEIGIIRYYEKYGNFYKPDTIIGKCQ